MGHTKEIMSIVDATAEGKSTFASMIWKKIKAGVVESVLVIRTGKEWEML